MRSAHDPNDQPSLSREEARLWPSRILLAEDDPDLRVLLATSLRADGYRVFEAPDGERLLDMVASQLLYSKGSSGIVDLIVTDIKMPGPSGLWALATLRHLDWVTPVLIITAFDDAQTRAEARRLGAAGMLIKPIDVDAFRSAVANLAGPALPSTPASEHLDSVLPFA